MRRSASSAEVRPPQRPPAPVTATRTAQVPTADAHTPQRPPAPVTATRTGKKPVSELEEIRRQAANAQQLLQDLRERQKLLEGVESLKDVQDGVKPVVESLKDDKPLSAKAHTGLCYRARRTASLKKSKSRSLASVESEENGCVAWL